jgi:lysyl-tRNA synthetase class 2
MIEDYSSKLAAKSDSLFLRAKMLQAIRRFFMEKGFLEVETPLLIPAPAPEVHIDAVAAGDWFLQTSPELCMKRLLAAGYRKIFQICKCFRAKERGARHLPEFTILEWYRADADYHNLMDDCEDLIAGVASQLAFSKIAPGESEPFLLEKPWQRITVSDAFVRYAGMQVSEALDSDRFDEVLACSIEPLLGLKQPVFLCDYPKEHGSLARFNEKKGVAERFELYIAGIEIANGFSELNDADEQRRRFEEASQEREKRGHSVYPLSEKFLGALRQMPPSAGIAVGVDRLAMLFAGKKRIDDVVAFTPEIL